MFPESGVRERRSENRRRHARVGLSVPVQFGRGREQEKASALAYVGQSRDVGTGGVYLTTQGSGSFVPGDILNVSIPIPWEAQRGFPFSRITGIGRVVRVEAQGVAVEFCRHQLTMLGVVGRS